MRIEHISMFIELIVRMTAPGSLTRLIAYSLFLLNNYFVISYKVYLIINTHHTYLMYTYTTAQK